MELLGQRLYFDYFWHVKGIQAHVNRIKYNQLDAHAAMTINYQHVKLSYAIWHQPFNL